MSPPSQVVPHEGGGTAARPMTKTEARQLTRAISDSLHTLHKHMETTSSLLHRAHEEKAWVPLGHESWEDYVVTQFGISRQYAYRLINNAKQMMAAVEKPKPLQYSGEVEVVKPVEVKTQQTLKDLERFLNRTQKLSEEKDELTMDVQIAIIKAQVAVRQLARLLRGEEPGAE